MDMSLRMSKKMVQLLTTPWNSITNQYISYPSFFLWVESALLLSHFGLCSLSFALTLSHPLASCVGIFLFIISHNERTWRTLNKPPRSIYQISLYKYCQSSVRAGLVWLCPLSLVRCVNIFLSSGFFPNHLWNVRLYASVEQVER